MDPVTEKKNTAKWLSSLFVRIAILQTFTMLSNALAMIVDSVVVARHLAECDMAAFGLISPVCSICFSITSVFGCGIGIISIRSAAESGAKKARDVFFGALFSAIFLSGLLAVGLIVFTKPIAVLLCGNDVSAPVFDGACTYLRCFAPALPAMVASISFLSTFHIDQEDRLLAAAVVVSTAVNIVLDYLSALVFQNGLFGMALATVVSMYAQAAILSAHLFRKNVIFKFQGAKPDFSRKLSYVRLGLPGAIRNAMAALLTLFMNKIILRVSGEEGVSALAALATAAILFRAAADASQSAVVSFTTLFDGERNEKMIRRVFSLGNRFAMLVSAGVAVFVFLFSQSIMGLFFSPGQVLDYAVTGLRYVAAGLVPFAAASSLIGAYLALGDAKRVLAISILFDFAVPLLCVLVQTEFLGLNGVWLSYVTGKVVLIAAYLLYLLLRERRRLLPGNLLVLNPERYRNIRSYEFETTSPADCAAISARIYRCMLENGADSKEAYAFSLAAEELGNYTFQYGEFGADRYFGVFLCLDGDSRILRIRNNAKVRNPLRCLSGQDQVDEFSLVGIQMVRKMIRSVEYVYTAGINNIILMFKNSEEEE